MGSGKGGGGGAKVYDYFGTIAGIVCAGPVDELVEILVDGKTVWPTAAKWKSGTSYTTGNLVQDKGVVYKATSNHTANAGNRPPNASTWTRYTITRALSANPVALTVEGFGMAYLYWGTSTQTLDAVGEATLSAKGHPPYRRQCVLVLKDFLFGRERVSAPNVEAIVRKYPSQTMVTGDAAGLTDGQSNPIAALADLYTDPVFGAGLVPNAVGAPNSTSWNAAAGSLHTDNGKLYISPILQRAQSLRQITAAMLAYCDGWLRFATDGTIEAGRFPHNAAPPSFTAANTIDFHDLIEEANYDAAGWSQTFNQAVVKFVDRARAYKDAAVASVNGYNLTVTGEPRSVTVDRPWITRRQQASDQAAEHGKINAEPRLSGSLVVRAEKAAAIRQGDQFLLTHDALAVSIVCRCLHKDLAQPPAGRVTIQFENDRAAAPVPYQPTPVADEGTEFDANETLSLQQIFQPPPALIEGDTDAAVVPLVARTSNLTTGANVWLRQADLSGFYKLGSLTQFAIYGTLQQNYNPTMTYATTHRARTSNVATITIGTHGLTAGMTVTVSGLADDSFNGAHVLTAVGATTISYANTGADVATTADAAGTVDPWQDDVTEVLRVTMHGSTNAADLAKMLATQTEDAIADGAVCVVVFDAGNPKNFEVMTLRAMRIVGGDSFYRLKVRRAQYGTARRNAVTNDRAFIVYRADLVSLSSDQFVGNLANLSTATFRLQAANAESVADLSDATLCPNISYTFNDPYAPAFAFDSVKADGVEVTDFATDYTTATEFTVAATITDGSADLIEARLFAKLGSLEVTIWSRSFQPSASQAVTTTFKLPTEGDWIVYLEGRDLSGRVTQKQMTPGGGGSPVSLKIGVGTGSTVVANPTASPSSGGSTLFYVTLACSTAGATIKYNVSPGWVLSPSGGFSTYSAQFMVGLSMGNGFKTTVFAYAEKGGMTTSETVRFLYSM